MSLFNDENRLNTIKTIWKQRNLRILAWTSIFFLLMLSILAIQFLSGQSDWVAGQVSNRDVQSDRYLTFVDEAATLSKQEEALQGFQDIYKVDLEKFNNITILSISDYFAQLETTANAVQAGTITEDRALEQLRNAYDFNLTAEEWMALSALSEGQIQTLYDRGIDYATSVMSQGVAEENIAEAKEKVAQYILNDRRITGPSEAFLLAVLNEVKFYPTYVYDKTATEEKKAEILSTVDPVKIVVQKGEQVVRKGEIVSDREIQILQMLGYAKDESGWWILLGLSMLLLLMIFITRLFLKFFIPKLYQDEKQLILLMLLVAITVGMYKMILSLSLSPVADRAAQVGYLIPVAVGTILIAILQDVRLAILIDIFLAVLVGLYTNSISFAIVAMLGGIVGALGVSSLGQRSDISKTALRISLVNAITIIALGLLNNQAPDVIFMGIIFGVFNGFFSSVFAIGILPYLEYIFGVTTSIKLLELANPNQPLLKRLLSEAPGTYHHCVMVGNLGEAAADAIGANGLLVRLGAYYHDIGKLKRPYFFSENQFSGDNPHNNITPQLSTLIITSHVKDGIEMATEAKLPPVILDMIAQHHGDSLVSFFFYKAKEQDENVKESDFRYDQRKPQTKEAAILMMADTVEAAVRSKKDATPGQLEGFIRTLIKGKLEDGQFDECELTFRDLDQVASAFVRVVTGIYHKRIEYPNQATLEKKKNQRRLS